jgi:hypothetical protein
MVEAFVRRRLRSSSYKIRAKMSQRALLSLTAWYRNTHRTPVDVDVDHDVYSDMKNSRVRMIVM